MAVSPHKKPREHPGDRMALWARLVLVSWAALLIALVVGGSLATFLLVRHERASWEAQLGAAGLTVAQTTANFLSHAQHDLMAMEYLGVPALEADPGQAELILQRHDSFLEVAFFEPGGALIAGAFRDQPVLVAQENLVAAPWFSIASQGGTYADALQTPSTGGRSLVLAQPGNDGRVIGARLRLDALDQLAGHTGLGAGTVFILDSSGNLITQPPGYPPSEETSVRSNPTLMSLAQITEATFVRRCQDVIGTTSLCSGTPVEGTDWVSVAIVPETEAYQPTVRALAAMGGALLLVAVIVALLIRGWMRGLVFRPVEALQRGAEAFGRGALEHTIPIYRRDEIGRVAESMNAMAMRLQGQRDTIERHSIQLETLYRVSLSLTKRLDLESVLETVLNAAFELFPGLMDALVFLYADDRLTLAASRRGPAVAGTPSPTPRLEGSTYRVARTGEMVLIPDVHADPRYPGDQRHWPGALACIPLKVGTHVVGVLNASYLESHPFAEDETRLLLLLADQAAIAVENARLYGQAQQELLERRRAEQALQKANEDLERRVSSRTHALLEANQRLETLKEIDRAILAAQSLDDIAMAGLTRLRALVGCEHAALVMFELEAGIGRVLTMEGPRTFGLEAGKDFSLEDYGPLADLKAGEVRRVNDLESVASLTPLRQRLLDGGLRSFLTVPLIADDALIGELNLASSRAAAFDIDTELLAREVANQLAVALRQAGLRAALEAEQRRLGQLVEHLPQAVALLDGDKRVVLANAQARKILPQLGRWPSTASLHQVGGRPVERLLVSPDHPGWHELRLEAGARRVYEAAALRLGEPPEAGGWIVQIRDVTSERAAQMQQRSQERLAAVGQLAAGVAHDFNNIISVIILYAEMLLQVKGRTAQELDRLQTITQQGQRAAQLIQQILDFSRQSVMDQHPFDLVPFLREMEGLLMRTMPESIRVRMVAEGTGFMILGDPARIRQACINLALNAREAMPEGGDLRFALAPLSLKEGEAPPCVEMTPGEWVRLTVSDTGSGIQPEAMAHIFEPFFTTKSPAKASGLGLAQVYGIIQQHHGQIDVTSSKEGGTTFTIFLPVLAAPASSGEALEASQANRGQGELILVVEDNEATRSSVCEILANLGYRVLQASEGKQALEIFAQHAGTIDLVLSDLVMPGMGGSELVRQLTAAVPQQRILLMTGYPLGGTRELLESGTVHWLQKPLSGAKLARAVREALTTGRGKPAPA